VMADDVLAPAVRAIINEVEVRLSRKIVLPDLQLDINSRFDESSSSIQDNLGMYLYTKQIFTLKILNRKLFHYISGSSIHEKEKQDVCRHILHLTKLATWELIYSVCTLLHTVDEVETFIRVCPTSIPKNEIREEIQRRTQSMSVEFAGSVWYFQVPKEGELIDMIESILLELTGNDNVDDYSFTSQNIPVDVHTSGMITSIAVVHNPPKPKQGNGNNGEWTNSDDPPKRNPRKNAASKLMAEMQKLEIQVSKLRPNSKKKGGRRLNGRKVGIPGKKGLQSHPVAQIIKGLIDPANVGKGQMSCLLFPRPSQKVSATLRQTIALGVGEECIIFINPAACNDTTRPSVVIVYGSSANMNLSSSTFTSTTVGVGWTSLTGILTATNTPYTAATMGANNMNWRNVANGGTLRFNGAKQYKGGSVTYLDNVDATFFSEPGDRTTTTFVGLRDRMNTDVNTVKREFSTVEAFEFTVAGTDIRFAGGSSWTTFMNLSESPWTDQRVGGTTSTYVMGTPASCMYLINNTGVACGFLLEYIEHWEFIGQSIENLHTPSHTSPGVIETLNSVHRAAKQHQSAHHKDNLVQSVKKVMKTPHGKQLIELGHDVLKAGLEIL